MMKVAVNLLLSAFLFLFLGFSKAEALVIFNEGVSGDLSFAVLQNFNLGWGSNEVIGSVQEVQDIFDPFAINIASGQQLDSINLVSFSDPFVALSLYASADASSNYMGGALIDSSLVGSDVLFAMSGNSSLSTGTYSLRFFTNKSTQSFYRIGLEVGEANPDGSSNSVPEPATMVLFSAGLAGMFLKTRKCS